MNLKRIKFAYMHLTLMVLYIIYTLISIIAILKGGSDPNYLTMSMVLFPFMFYSLLNANVSSICYRYLKNNIFTKAKKVFVVAMTFLNMLIFVAMLFITGYFLYTSQPEFFRVSFIGMLVAVIPLTPMFITIIFTESAKTDSSDSEISPFAKVGASAFNNIKSK